MEEIKVNDYVRINKDFRTICLGIGRVINKAKDIVYVKMSSNDLPIAFNVDSIAKHSPNIIDLIEVSDYVNGKRVEGIDNKVFNDHREIFFENECWYVKDYRIESIVTHEQFNSIKYEVI